MAENEADRLVARAIESVLDQVPGAIDTSVPEGASAKLQPWAETAAPAGRNKRLLEELLTELAERVGADPGARAAVPTTRHPGVAFFDRFGRGRGQVAADATGETGAGSGRRRRRRRGGGGGRAETAAAAPATTAPSGTPERTGGGRRRSRRGGGGGGGGGAGQGAPSTGAGSDQRPAAPQGQGQRPPGSGRRRRGRRGRGGGSGGAGSGGVTPAAG